LSGGFNNLQQNRFFANLQKQAVDVRIATDNRPQQLLLREIKLHGSKAQAAINNNCNAAAAAAQREYTHD
jgi:hypothetical protein